MSRKKNKVNGNQKVNENVNVKEETMKKEETVERTEDIQDLTDEELGVEPEEVDDNEYEYDENGQKIKIVYVEVKKPSKIKSFFNRHRKVLTGIGVGILTAGAGAAGAAIAYNVGKKTNGVNDVCGVDDDLNYIKVTTDDQDLIDKITDDVMNSATTSPTSDGIMEF